MKRNKMETAFITSGYSDRQEDTLREHTLQGGKKRLHFKMHRNYLVVILKKELFLLLNFPPHRKEGAERCGCASLSSLVSFTKC